MPRETDAAGVPSNADEFDLSETVPHRLETIAAQAPERLALTGKDASFTYSELNAYADGVARLLAPASSPGDRAVVYLGHGARIIAAIMGVLEAGRVYVPVDPTYPAARNGLILADADASVILTDDANLAGAQAIARPRQTIINLDKGEPASAEADVNESVTPDTPACLIYTSGSTGRPKGVLHTHQTLLHDGYRRAVIQRITSDDRMTLLYSPSVMGAVHGIFTALWGGASLYVNNFQNESIRGLIEWIQDEQVTVYHSVATVFRELASQFRPDDAFLHVRLVIFGGERALRADLENVWKWFPDHCKVFGGFGTTEVGTVRGWLLDRTTEYEGDVVPSGYPAPGTDVRVITETGEPAEPGQPGEVAVTSPFIFQCYWQDPESTQAVLSQSPDDPRCRTYCTGDQAVLAPDGRLTLSGRKDAQLSIRGFRVETGEIESALLSHPKVVNAAVVVCGRDTPDSVLSAFVMGEPGAKVSLTELRAFAQERLPAHMVPSHYGVVDELPTTPNNKIDRMLLEIYKALPVIDAGDYVPPRDELEASLIALSERVLTDGRVGIRTNLLEAGLSSLMAVRLLTEIERRFACRIPLNTLFNAPTIAALAARLRDDIAPDKRSSTIVINPTGARPPLICLPGISGVASFTYRTLAEHVGDDQPFYALQLQGLDGEAHAHDSVQEMAAHHIGLMRELQPEGPYSLIGYSFGGRLAFEMADQLRASGEEIALLALLDTYAPGYPEIASLSVRCRLHLQNLIRMAPKERIDYLNDHVKTRAKKMQRYLTRFTERLRPAPEPDEDATFDERIQTVLRITRRAARQYRPRVYPGDIVLFRATERPVWLGASFEDPHNGWSRYTTGTIHVRTVPGVHLDMLKEPNVQLLGRALRACLDETPAT